MRTLFTSFRLSTTYWANTLIYRLRQLPLIRRLIPVSLYGCNGLKQAANILVVLFKILYTFCGKFAYIGLMVILPLGFLPGSKTDNFVHILFFLTLVGAFSNTELFNPSKAKYYTIVLMRSDAKSYALSSFAWFLIKNFITFLPAAVILGREEGMPLVLCLLVPVFVVAAKLTGGAVMLQYYDRTGKALSENNMKFAWSIIGIGMLLAYGLPFIKIRATEKLFFAACLAGVVLAVFAARYLWKSKSYKGLYKQLLSPNALLFQVMESPAAVQQKNYLSKISQDEIYEGSKTGYGYFNEIFTRRHKKILTHSARKTAYLCFFVLVGTLVVTRINPGAYKVINHLMLTFLPYFVFVMYLLNRGAVVTQAMFMNCDHSMLTYRFYRQPDTILQLFKARLVTLVKINMMPAAVIACGLPLLLFFTGGTENPLNYVLLFISILAMSVFFSVHHLVIYYLLQPYNVNMQAKGSMYAVVNWGTYFLCYMCIKFQAPTLLFASLTIVFCVLYIGLALFLVYRYAPARFKLKQ